MKNEEAVNKGFKDQLQYLKEIYEDSTLKEKHKINEHIKNILKTHGNKNNQEIEAYLNKEADSTSK